MEQARAGFSGPCSAESDASASEPSLTLVTTEWVTITEQTRQKAKKGGKALHGVEVSTKNGRPDQTSTLVSQNSPTLLFHIPQPPGPMTIHQITETIHSGVAIAW